MDEYSGKRASEGLGFSRKGSGILLRETSNRKDSNARVNNRVGSSGRLNSMKATQIERARPSPLSYSSGKEKIGSTSKVCSASSNTKKYSMISCKNVSSQLETDSSETSSVHDEPEVSELNPPPGKIQRGIHLLTNSAKTSELSSTEVGSSSVASNTRSRRNSHQRFGFLNQDASVGSSVSLGYKAANQATHAGETRYGLRNLRCNSVSDVVSSSPSLDVSLSRRRETIKKRNSEGESSSAYGGKKIIGSASGKNPTSNHCVSICDSSRVRNTLPKRDNGAASVRTRRSIIGYPRAGLPNRGSGNSSSHNESPTDFSQLSHSDSIDINVSGMLQPSSDITPALHWNSWSQPGCSSNRNLHGIESPGPVEIDFPHSYFPHSLMNRDSLRPYNMDGIAEVLLALERIEHSEGPTYEQILALETNLFLHGLNFHDQHRDMRLDIDNMSYEELLALEEKMGMVSTALTEDALSECLKRSIFEPLSPEGASTGSSWDNDELICSICQEEYVAEDEVGRLHCEHMYHVDCIHQWLRLKNWCPICKASAAPSPPCPSPTSPQLQL